MGSTAEMLEEQTDRDEFPLTSLDRLEDEEGNIFFELSRADVALRAYDLFIQRGGVHGHDMEDWQQAEREFTSFLLGPIDLRIEEATALGLWLL